MGKFDLPFTAFGGGEIGREVLGRVNLEGYGATASLLENMLPDTAGQLHFSPGLKFCATGPAAGSGGRLEPFFYRDNAKFLLWFSENELRFTQDGGVIVTLAVSSAIANGTFVAGLAGWTNISGGSSTAVGGVTGLVLDGDGANTAGVRQQCSTSSAGTQHSLQIRVTRGPVTFKCGSTAGGDDYIGTTALRTGTHVLSFTPSGSYWIEFTSILERQIIVQDVSVLGSGDLVLPTIWDADEIWTLRLEPSLNVTYVTDGTSVKKRIERRGASSWSIVESSEADGPFILPNVDSTFTLTPSVLVGNGTLTASRALFKAEHVGALFQITHTGQSESRTVTGADQWTNPILVTGVGTTRQLAWSSVGAMTATVRLQRSVGNTTSWTDVTGGTGTSSTTVPGSFTFRDSDDNVQIYYRLGVKTGEYTSGSPVVTISFPFGTTTGVARVTGFVSSTVVNIEVLDNFSAITATSEWAEGAWSDYRGHPKGIAIFNGRLWNGRDDEIWGSGSDLYESQAAGDADDNAIDRTISVGSSAPQVLWLLGLSNKMIAGISASSSDVQPIKTGTGLITVSSSALDEALTPANTNIRAHDASGIYVDQSSHTAMELVWSAEAGDYAARSLMRLHKDIGRPGIVQLAFSSRPDMRLYMIRSDGQLLVKLFDHGENTMGWSRRTTDGEIKSVAVLPGADEDEVYVLVDRSDDTQPWQLEKLDPFYLASKSDANRLDSYVRSEVGRAWTANGNAQIDTAQSKFGGSALLLDGTGDYLSFADSSDFTLGSRGWTIDFWFRCNAAGGTVRSLAGQCDSGGTAASTAFRIYRDTTNNIRAFVCSGASFFTAVGTTQFTDVLNTGWHHCAFVRTGDVLRLFIDGVQEGGDTAITVAVNDSSEALTIGADTSAGSNPWAGWIDEFRISIDAARWTANFTAPSAAYDPDGFTRALLHFDGADASTTMTDVGAASVLSGIDHLNGKQVSLWGDGAYMGTATVAGGQVTFSAPKVKRVAGLYYRGRYRGSRLAVGAQAGSALAQQGKPTTVAFMLENSTRHIKYGTDFDTMDLLSDRIEGSNYDTGPELVSETTDWMPLAGDFNRDPRLHLEVESPYPVTLQGLILGHALSEKIRA